MQDVNSLKNLLVEQKKGAIHIINNIVEDTPARRCQRYGLYHHGMQDVQLFERQYGLILMVCHRGNGCYGIAV